MIKEKINSKILTFIIMILVGLSIATPFIVYINYSDKMVDNYILEGVDSEKY